MYLQFSQNMNRLSHKDLLSLRQSLTSLRIMAKLNRIKAGLAEQDKTSKWLAEQVGKSTCTVSKWCNNVVQPDLNTLDKIAKLLDIDVKDLLNSTEKNKLAYYSKSNFVYQNTLIKKYKLISNL